MSIFMDTKTGEFSRTGLAKSEEHDQSHYAEHPEDIQVGMGVTLRTGMGGVYVPYSIIEVRRGGKELVIQRDRSHFGPTYSWAGDTSDVEYSTNPNGRIETVTLRNDKTFIVKGAPKEWYSTRYYVGYRRDWTDFSQ